MYRSNYPHEDDRMDRIRRLKRSYPRQCWLDDNPRAQVPANQMSFAFVEDEKRSEQDHRKEETVDR